MVSGSAGCAAYLDGEKLHFIHPASAEGWRTATHSELRHIFLQASDVVEMEVDDRRQAESVAKFRTKVTHALRLIELLMTSKLAEVAALSDEYLDEWLVDHLVLTEVEKFCFATPAPESVNFNEILSRTTRPRSKALLQEIFAAQPRIRRLGELLDIYSHMQSNLHPPTRCWRRATSSLRCQRNHALYSVPLARCGI
jgi:hypothetical protein